MKKEESQAQKVQFLEQKKPTEQVIEQIVINSIYSINEDLFRNKTRFETVLTDPNPRFQFETVKGIFKGRFICKNDSCKQQKLHQNPPHNTNQIPQQNSDDQRQAHESWLEWWKKKQSKTKPQIEQQHRFSTTSNDSFKIQVNNRQVKKEQSQGKKEQTQTENTRWSSSLSYMILNYRSFPAPLPKIKQVYERQKNEKIEIYFYIELMGQKCKTCLSNDFCYPFFGKTELKRMRNNFSNFIYNKIHNKPILRYKSCKLRRLRNHRQQLCQACSLGQCRLSNF